MLNQRKSISKLFYKNFKLGIQCQHNSDLCWFTSCYSFDFRMPNFQLEWVTWIQFGREKKADADKAKYSELMYFYRIYYYAPYSLKVEIYQGNNAIVRTILPHLLSPVVNIKTKFCLAVHSWINSPQFISIFQYIFFLQSIEQKFYFRDYFISLCVVHR